MSSLSFNKKALLLSAAVSTSNPDKSTFDEIIFKFSILVSLTASSILALPFNVFLYVEPVLFTFPIQAYSKDSTSTVIDATPLFSKDVKSLGLPQFRRRPYKVTRLESDKSFIETIKSYPKNIEARHVKTYAAGSPPSNWSTGSISIEINNSMILE